MQPALTRAFLVLMAGGLTSMQPAHALNCKKAVTATERALCSDVSEAMEAMEAMQYDEILNNTYGSLMGALKPAARDALRTEQRAWLKTRDLCKGDLPCITKSTVARLTALNTRWCKEFPPKISKGISKSTSDYLFETGEIVYSKSWSESYVWVGKTKSGEPPVQLADSPTAKVQAVCGPDATEFVFEFDGSGGAELEFHAGRFLTMHTDGTVFGVRSRGPIGGTLEDDTFDLHTGEQMAFADIFAKPPLLQQIRTLASLEEGVKLPEKIDLRQKDSDGCTQFAAIRKRGISFGYRDGSASDSECEWSATLTFERAQPFLQPWVVQALKAEKLIK